MPRNPGTLILRSDASTAMGTGHVMRCLALAQAWEDAGGWSIFAIVEGVPAVRERLLADKMEVVPLEISAGGEDDARKVAELALRHAAEWVAVDSYQFGADYQRQLKAAGLKLLFVDDNGHAGHYSADLVLNQNAHANESFYSSREPYTRLLLGLRYSMLRREFSHWHEWKREISAVGRKVLVTMGGSDPDGLTLSVIKALAGMRNCGIRVTVVVGGSNPGVEKLQQAAKGMEPAIQLFANITDMAAIMAESDLAVVCGGGTLWEVLYMGCATLSYSRPGTQRQVVEALGSAGVLVNLGPAEDFGEGRLQEAVNRLISSAQSRQNLAQQGRRSVDGRGTSRVLQALWKPDQ